MEWRRMKALLKYGTSVEFGAHQIVKSVPFDRFHPRVEQGMGLGKGDHRGGSQTTRFVGVAKRGSWDGGLPGPWVRRKQHL